MMFAKVNRIPVAVWLRKSRIIKQLIHLLGREVRTVRFHAFIYNLGDYLAPTLEDVARWIEKSYCLATSLLRGWSVPRRRSPRIIVRLSLKKIISCVNCDEYRFVRGIP